LSTTGREYRLAIRIAGIIDRSFTTSLTAANSALRKNITTINSNFTTLDKGFNKIMTVGKSCFTAIATAAGVATLAIGAVTAASIAVGTAFETAFAGVKKTVDATEEEYERLRQDILDMASELPSSAVEIAKTMEIAGQLGISNDALTDFTETMINLGVSTNLAAEDAATALARFSNIMTMKNYGEDGISNYERLGSTIVDLGNNFATTETEIVNIATALAAAGNLAKMSEADIMGISAAMSSVGLTAEAGASAMSRLIMQMQQAVAEGEDELAQYAETAGMSAKNFASLFRDDAASAVVKFIEGLNQAGEDSYGILEDLELSTIRTRKAFLSLAGADDLMIRAVDMANEAWEENTALAIEAGKRYETTASQLKIMGNAFKELGIIAYDDLRAPFIEVINTITDKVSGLTEYVGGPDGISKWLKNISTTVPTLQRNIKKYGGEIIDFFTPLLNIGKWFLKNPQVIISALAGIGTVLATYKIASTLVHIVNALMTLGSMHPVTLTILGIAAALGIFVGALTAYKQHEMNLVNNSLAEHFGNITLSMKEIQAIAEYIVSSDSLGGVKEALEAFEDLGTISSTMENAIEEINKMNWKVSIGMELTPDEQESYKESIQEYVSAAQEYALQSQYAVSLNLAIGLDENSSVVDKVNQFYADKYDELSALGTQLNQSVTDAFNDGLLDIKETKVIAEIQAQMAAIEEALATGEFDAQMSILGMEYAGGGSLTADSFQNLQAELATQVAAATEAYKESYAKNYAAIQASYAGEYLTDSEYQNAMTELQEEYLKNVSEVQMRAINFQIETIMNQYAAELDPAMQEYIQNIQKTIGDYTEYGEQDWISRPVLLWQTMLDDISESTLDKTTKGAISKLLESMAPSMEQMEELIKQYEAVGGEIPLAILEGFSSYNMLNALSNEDMESIANILGEQMANSEYYDSFYRDVMNKIVEVNNYIPEEVASGIATAAHESIRPAVEGMYAWSQETIDEYFSKGFNVQTGVNIQLNPTLNGLRSWSAIAGINNRANGGLATRPELTWFAENGPEMAIPIDGSRNAISLWEQTGRLLGMNSALDGLDLGGGSGPTIEYSPTLQFYGDAPSKDDLEDALRVSQDEFDSLMERYLRTHRRVSFG
jgi:TP901 family phage tail tape measure protein